MASGQTATSMFAGHYTELVDRFGEPDTDESRGALDCIDAARRHGHWAGVSAAECDVVLRWDVGERCAVLHVSATTERDGVVALTMYYPERRALDAGALRDPLPLDPS